MSGRDQHAKLQKKTKQAQKVLQRAEQQTTSSKGGGLEQPLDGLGQLSPAQTADLQRTYGNGFLQQLVGHNKAGGGDGETPVQREVGDRGKPVGGDVEQRIQRTRGGGSPLPKKTRQQMEGHMGADFSGVRVHHNQESDQLNRSLNAEAFTTGKDVYFRQGGYNPDSKDGKQLIAHELTHVVQQGAAAKKPVQKMPSDTIQRADEDEEKKKAKEEAKSKARAGKDDANAKGRDDESKAKEKENQDNEKQQKQEKPEGKEKAAVPFAQPDAEEMQDAMLPEDGGEAADVDLEYLPLPSWNELAEGTVQLLATGTGKQKTKKKSNQNQTTGTESGGGSGAQSKPKVGTLAVSDATQSDKDSSSSFSLSELNDEGEQVEMEIDRGKIAGDALKEGAWEGFKEGGLAVVQNAIIGTASQKIPATGGLLAIAQIAYDPDQWFKDNVIGIGDKAVAIGTAFKGISGEDTGWGKAAAILELVVAIMDFVTSITGLVGTILDIITAVCILMIALAPVVPFGIMAWTPGVFGPIKAFIAPISRVLDMINNGITLIKLPLQGFITWFRYMDLMQTKADPQKLMEKQAKLKGAMKGFVSSATETAGGKAIDKVQAKREQRKQKNEMRKELSDIEGMENSIKNPPPDTQDVAAYKAAKREEVNQKKAEFHEKFQSDYKTERDLKKAKEEMDGDAYKKHKKEVRDARQTEVERRIENREAQIKREQNPEKKAELEQQKANLEGENARLKNKLGTIHMKKKRYEQSGKSKKYIAKKVGQGAFDAVTLGARHRSEADDLKSPGKAMKESWAEAKTEASEWRAKAKTKKELKNLQQSKADHDNQLDASKEGTAAYKKQQDLDNLQQKRADLKAKRDELKSARDAEQQLQDTPQSSKKKVDDAVARAAKAEKDYQMAKAQQAQAQKAKNKDRRAKKGKYASSNVEAKKKAYDQAKKDVDRAQKHEAAVKKAHERTNKAKQDFDSSKMEQKDAQRVYSESKQKVKGHQKKSEDFDGKIKQKQEERQDLISRRSLKAEFDKTLNTSLASSDVGYKGFLAQILEDTTGLNIFDWFGEDWDDTDKLKARRAALHERAVAAENRGYYAQAAGMRKAIAKIDKRIAQLTAQGKAKDATADFLKKYTNNGQGIITLTVSLPGLPTANKYQDVDLGTDQGKAYQNDFEKDASAPDANVVDITRTDKDKSKTTYDIKDPAGGSILLPSSGKIDVKAHDVKMQTKFGVDGTISKYAPAHKYTFKPQKHAAPVLDATKRTVTVEVPYKSDDFNKAYEPSTNSTIDADWEMMPNYKNGINKSQILHSAGEVVRISGTNFLGQTQRAAASSDSYSVKFGDVASGTVNVTDTEIQATVPVGKNLSPVPIKVSTPYSNGEQTLNRNFTYDAPALTSATLPTTQSGGVTKLGSNIVIKGTNLQGTTQVHLTNGTDTQTYTDKAVTPNADGSTVLVAPPSGDSWHGKEVDVTVTSMGQTLKKEKAFTFPTPTAQNDPVQTKPIQRAGGGDEDEETLNQQNEAEGAESEISAANSSAAQNQEPTIQIGGKQVGNQPQPEPPKSEPEPEMATDLSPDMQPEQSAEVEEDPKAALEELGQSIAEEAPAEAAAPKAPAEEEVAQEGGTLEAEAEGVEETAVVDEEDGVAEAAEAEAEEDIETEGVNPESIYRDEAEEQEPIEQDVTFGATEDERDMMDDETPNAFQMLADQREADMLENMPDPPENVAERVEGARTAMAVLDSEQHGLMGQQQDIAEIKQDANAQHESMEGVRAIGQANQMAMEKHQQDADQKLDAQNEMKEASQEKQKEADSTSEQGSGINKMMSGLISPIMAAVGMGGSRKETKPEAGGNPNPAQAGEGTKKMDKATTDSAQLVKDTGPMKNQEIAETTSAKNETAGMQKEVAHTDAMLESKQDETSESIDTLSTLQEENDEKISNFEEQKEEQITTQEEALDEYAIWQEEVAMLREDTFMQLEADLDSGAAEEALAA